MFFSVCFYELAPTFPEHTSSSHLPNILSHSPFPVGYELLTILHSVYQPLNLPEFLSILFTSLPFKMICLTTPTLTLSYQQALFIPFFSTKNFIIKKIGISFDFLLSSYLKETLTNVQELTDQCKGVNGAWSQFHLPRRQISLQCSTISLLLFITNPSLSFSLLPHTQLPNLITSTLRFPFWITVFSYSLERTPFSCILMTI